MNLKTNLKKFFCILSGDDYGIVGRCCPQTENRFVGIGLFVLLVFVLCFVSSYFSFTKLFPNYWVGFGIALFFAWMITNIYLLLLYTLSKNVLPHERAMKTIVFSTVLRIMFVCFIAVVVSKPLEALIFSRPLERDINDYKQQKLAEYAIHTEEFFAGEIEQFKLLIEKQKNLGSDKANARIEKYQLLISDKEKQKTRMLADMQSLVNQSNFYVQSIVILNNKYPACWLLTFCCISIFLAPAVLKNLISEKSDYYALKRRIETEFVRDQYFSFKALYRRIFENNFGEARDYVEHYLDAPFNTISKTERTHYLIERDLLKELYDA